MSADFIFHHVAIAVRSIEKTAAIYCKSGFTSTQPVIDPVQNVRICFLMKQNMPLYELVEPIDVTSPVSRILDREGITPYHICYEVDDIDEAIHDLKKQKYLLIQTPVPAIALNNRKICFMFHKDVGLIELLERSAVC
ncbi:MAG: VOC family protein [Tannerella sp.]|jgi:methylmalonyl-CoA/ethylmalonyl-CoA epimerase|nr:VOC family protein [Tannerella sp.]